MVVGSGFIADNKCMRFSAWLFVIVIIVFSTAAYAESTLKTQYLSERKLFIDFQLPSNEVLHSSAGERLAIKPLFVRLHNRLLAAVLRLEYLEGALAKEISSAEKSGVDISILRIKMATAKEKTLFARLTLFKSGNDFEKIYLTKNPVVAYEAVENAINYDVIANIQISHALLIEIVSSLREISQ